MTEADWTIELQAKKSQGRDSDHRELWRSYRVVLPKDSEGTSPANTLTEDFLNLQNFQPKHNFLPCLKSASEARRLQDYHGLIQGPLTFGVVVAFT